MKEQIELYKDFVRALYATRDIAHNFEHIERIIRRIDRLSEGIRLLARPRFGRRLASDSLRKDEHTRWSS